MTNEMERTPYVSESLRVRCPSCRKLYLVQFGDIKEAKPRFECVQCRTRFWLSLPDMDLSTEVVGLPVQLKQVPVQSRSRKLEKRETEPCPKCFKPNTVGTSECAHCGILISKAKSLAFDESELAHSPALEAAWRKVIADYTDETAHADFLKLADRERNIPYAAAQYGQMQKLMPTDETTKAKLREIRALAETMLPPRRGPVATRIYGRLWQLPLLAAALLIVAGLAIPFFRNLVGVGAAFLFLGIAMQMQFRRRN